jgi:MFS family permease
MLETRVRSHDPVAAASSPDAGFGTSGYRAYVLNMLLLVYVLNFIDRGLLAVVARPLKAEIPISDTAWGLLTGFGFALLYTTAGLPIARIAETRNRVRIIAICLAFWSLMTAACGLAADVAIGGVVISAFWVLLACRIGVGLGEAGCTPPANSLIADYYPPRRRSTAIGYYSMGVTLGTMLANMIGGPVADWFGWRAAFLILGLPGVAVAVMFLLTTREPPRGYTDPPQLPRPEKVPLRDACRELLLKPSYWWMTAGATIAAFCGYAIWNFQSLFIQRTFDLTTSQAALWFNTPSAAAGAIGTVLLGWMAQRLSGRIPGAIAWLAAAGLFACVPLYVMAFTTASLWLCAAGLALASFAKYGYIGAQYTISQGVVSMRVRATATAVMLFLVNLLGYGLGPLFAGLVSDFHFAREQAGSIVGSAISRPMCDGAQQFLSDAAQKAGAALDAAQVEAVLGALSQPMTTDQYAFCLAANAQSTQASMLWICAIYVLAALAFAASARRLGRDLVA